MPRLTGPNESRICALDSRRKQGHIRGGMASVCSFEVQPSVLPTVRLLMSCLAILQGWQSPPVTEQHRTLLVLADDSLTIPSLYLNSWLAVYSCL